MLNETTIPYSGCAWIAAREAVRVEIDWAMTEGWGPDDIAAHLLLAFPELVIRHTQRKAR